MRDFPEQFSRPLRKVLNAVSFGIPTLVGSSADPRIMYSADYDLAEDVPVRRTSAATFQRKIKGIEKIGKIEDIKLGEISQWNLLTKPVIKKGIVRNYIQKNELAHLAMLWQQKIISHDEFMNANSMLTPHLTALEFLNARKATRFGLLRWSVEDVKRGYITLRNNSILRIQDAIKTPGITKIDVVAWVSTKYVEVSNIIVWTRLNGKSYSTRASLTQALSENILQYEAEGNYVKVAKRMLSLAKQYKHYTVQDKLTSILNSPLGKLYMVVTDLSVLKNFPNAITQARKRQEMDMLRNQFANLFFPELNHAVPSFNLLPKMTDILQREMKITLEKQHLLPIPKDYTI